MSDSTGPISGGTSGLLDVAESKSGANCNTTFSTNDFDFTTDSSSSPPECQPYHFTQFDKAILPITIFFYIPAGHESFTITPPPSDSFTWDTNLTVQTKFVTSMVDSHNRIGVQQSNNQSCINPDAISPPTSTPRPPLSTGGIVGVAIGGVVGLALLMILGFRLIKRRKIRRQTTGNVNLLEDEPVAASQPITAREYLPNPYPATLMNQRQQLDTNGTSSAQESSDTTVSHPRSKGASSKTGVLRRFIVHKDIEDEVEELPPEYSDRRRPVEGLSTQETGITSSATSLPDSD
ncbi:hypothetical protein GYMLUDRAFT_89112 [Collybiopsis luxurians FD-317 M1]|uniref:Unplaced genomic scaffold GYMLUscaffold_122, whole genome shotgun sequence n=1 Tax=Collybiopsis luxurians FD-317 M1 TaxID=944289 RepID=A0A0D0BA87_9AGAR|nr:hypothetical protein GYMLUDRAFT_89112 [Collybiopsis luxurians FD-317 M1]